MTSAADGPGTPEGAADGELVTPLAEPVRQRVVSLAADALAQLPPEQVPAPLKRVAAFAPGRRAKLAGTQIAGALEADPDFREHIGRQVRLALPAVAAALDAGNVPAAGDPVEVAAVAYLLRPPRWSTVVADAADAAEVERHLHRSRQQSEHADRLQRRLEEATEELRAARQRHRDELARLKADNAELRHRLGDVRARLRAAEEEVSAARGSADEAESARAAAGAAAEAEARRLRSRIEELEAEVAAGRRAERSDRGSGALRARLLLDTLLETAQGLRRELALPAVQGSPADQVAAHLAEQGSRTPTSHGSLSVDDPALLEQLLVLPRAHLVVDGYNVTKSAWSELSLERQRDRLVAGLAPLAARTGAETTVVFDAADTKERPPVNSPRRVRVLFSPAGVIADDVIRQLVDAEPPGRPVVVVTSDQAVVRDVTRAGARTAGAAALVRLLGRG